MTCLSIKILSIVDLCDTVQDPLHKPPGSVGFESKQNKKRHKARLSLFFETRAPLINPDESL